ncbi:Glu/Leu/Phe/Val dehydrogenase dimerization domain-containing protein [Sphingomonas sp. HITSZ_GF]|uniref:Glu/Leu/Phe/Val family dehydrogenase n=1 Tax=Sphingomonas sp. HITSZ_GF TaxID=3037247 RepID=UPI00240D36CA|nr:Glu/Leu/Phe/Val dehydrogenase dimerization domain-containing protein [Sphingomonas sp. HITSZ_GF]MDG2535705.1 Glu/Leu/Phe/Val dehydrogenase dimerization domain-containing protein [Sphingomonas sp. HITSZ_GF]
MVDTPQVSATPPESVHVLRDDDAGLRGVIVLHSTRRGPAAGGCRLWRYADHAALMGDAMRLAEGMTYKNAMADLPLGGGKAVLALPQGSVDRRRLFAAFGRAVARLEGDYVTAEDAGTGVADMEVVRGETRHVAGLPVQGGRPGGDPSPCTARGVFLAMEEAARRQLGSELKSLRVAVQGLGHVGSALCGMLHEAGARLIVAEPRPGVAAEIACRYDAEIMGRDSILDARCAIFAPCALGGVLDQEAVSRLRARVVCGAANNVLATPEDGDRLADRGILYAPDYVVNAGGIISVAGEYLGWSVDEVARRVHATGLRLGAVLGHAAREGLAPHRAADALARARITAAPASPVLEAA